jgi:glucosamine--fructose-6-phosphate aminotransferase (isomerizing)
MDESDLDRQAQLRRVADDMQKTLAVDEAVQIAAETYKQIDHCAVLGRGYSQATAAEAALKLMETSLISAHAYSAADFQHGPIAQVKGGFPCVVFAPDGKSFANMAALAERLRARHPALICFAHDSSILAVSDAAVKTPDSVPEWLSPLVYIVAAQLFAYRLCIAKGLNPDEIQGMNKVTSTL